MQDDILDRTCRALSGHLEALAAEVSRSRRVAGVDDALRDPFRIPKRFTSEREDIEPIYPSIGAEDKCANEIEAFALLEETLGNVDDAIRERNVEAIQDALIWLAVVWKQLAPDSEELLSSYYYDPDSDLHDEEREVTEHPLEPMEAVWEEIENAMENLEITEAMTIFVPSPATIIVPKLIVSVQQALIEMVRREPKSIFSISPRAFEELIAELFLSRGFKVELQQQTRDGGKDIVAIGSSMGIRHRYLIECKRYAPQRNVSIGAVQRLYAVKMSERANKAILATTSGFTRDAQAFASQHIWDLDLRAYGDIMDWIKSYRA